MQRPVNQTLSGPTQSAEVTSTSLQLAPAQAVGQYAKESSFEQAAKILLGATQVAGTALNAAAQHNENVRQQENRVRTTLAQSEEDQRKVQKTLTDVYQEALAREHVKAANSGDTTGLKSFLESTAKSSTVSDVRSHANTILSQVITQETQSSAAFAEKRVTEQRRLDTEARTYAERTVHPYTAIAENDFVPLEGRASHLLDGVGNVSEAMPIIFQYQIDKMKESGIPFDDTNPAMVSEVISGAAKIANKWDQKRHELKVQLDTADIGDSLKSLAWESSSSPKDALESVLTLVQNPLLKTQEEKDTWVKTFVTDYLSRIESDANGGRVSLRKSIALALELQTALYATYQGRLDHLFDKSMDRIVPALTAAVRTEVLSQSKTPRNPNLWLFTPPTKGGQRPVDALLLQKAAALGFDIPKGATDITSIPDTGSVAMQHAFKALRDVRDTVERDAKDEKYQEHHVGTPLDAYNLIASGNPTTDPTELNKAWSASFSASLYNTTDNTTSRISEIAAGLGTNTEGVTKILSEGTDVQKYGVFAAAVQIDNRSLGTNSVPGDAIKDINSMLHGADPNRVMQAVAMVKGMGGVGSPRLQAAMNSANMRTEEKADFIALAVMADDQWSDQGPGSPNGKWLSNFTAMRQTATNLEVRHTGDAKLANATLQTLVYGDKKSGINEALFKYLGESGRTKERSGFVNMTAEYQTAVETVAYTYAERYPSMTPQTAYKAALMAMESDGYSWIVHKTSGGTVAEPVYDTHKHVMDIAAADTAIREQMTRVVAPGKETAQYIKYFGVKPGVDTKGWAVWDFVQSASPEPRKLKDTKFQLDYKGNSANFWMSVDEPAYYEGQTKTPLTLETAWQTGGGVITMSDVNPKSKYQGIVIQGVNDPQEVFTWSRKSYSHKLGHTFKDYTEIKTAPPTYGNNFGSGVGSYSGPATGYK